MPRTRQDLDATITGLGIALDALSRLYTNPDLAPDDTTLVRESYADVTRMRNQMADIRERTK